MQDYNLKAFRKKFKDEGIFYTPEKLARTLLDYVDIDYSTAYDPTCGRGNLLKILGDDIKKYGQEKNKEELEVAKKDLINFIGYCGDTLEEDGFPDMQFDLVIANPPFSVKWDNSKATDDIRFKDAPCVPTNSKADYAFILHMLHKVSDEGVIVALNFPGILYRGQREGKIRKWLIEKNLIDTVVHVPPNSFEDTKIATCILVMRKNKKHSNIRFVDLERGKERVVTADEIRECGYTLSINTYIPIERIKEEIDPIQLNNDLRGFFKKHLRGEIQREMFVSEFEQISSEDYFYELINIIKTEGLRI